MNAEPPVMSVAASVSGSTTSVMFNDRTPLLSSQSRLFRSLSGAVIPSIESTTRSLTTFSGVFTPVCLSMFSALLFLRVGFIVGQAGVLQVLLQFFLAYMILVCTVLSISAISTNGAVEGGGVYYMISRTLGPEFGGSIGTLFFFANIFSSALYITGCVEGLVDNFAVGGNLVSGDKGLPSGQWWGILYASVIAFFNFLVCLIGATMFAKTSLIIFVIVIVSMFSVIVSVFAQHEKQIKIPGSNTLINRTIYGDYANYTGLKLSTFEGNVWSHYGLDYTSDSQDPVNFATVFGVLFSGVTGIMAGANMSGDLKEPSRSIPLGTLWAVGFTGLVYVILSLLTAGSCTNYLLHNDYLYMQSFNLWPPFVALGIFAATLSASLSTLIGASRVLEAVCRDDLFVVVGIFAATLSAALSNLIGASRVLEAVAKDNLFGILLRPVARGVFKGNPIFAVIISYLLVQAIVMIGSLNKIAQITSVLFLLSYCATNIACLALELASAPNFRPSFKFFTWHSCLVGLVGTLTMMFVINAIYAACCIIACLLLIIALHLRSPASNWGSISQALIFHQVRKYLLLLDSRKDHVKFWRPQMLLMVANPRTCFPLIDFVNDLKKSGLYVLGNIKVGNLELHDDRDPIQEEYPYWLSLIDHLKVKAFVELTTAGSVREGMHHLIRISGLGAMKPNTIVLGFYDNSAQEDFFARDKMRLSKPSVTVELGDLPHPFPQMRDLETPKQLSPSEYVSMVADAIWLQKNVCLCRHFHTFDKISLMRNHNNLTIDVWPVNFFQPDKHCLYDNTSLFVMQLACILNMVAPWKRRTRLRVMLCATTLYPDSLCWEKQIHELLKLLRIEAAVSILMWDETFSLYPYSERPAKELNVNVVSQSYIESVNRLIKSQSENTAVSFFYLCVPPKDEKQRMTYLHLLEAMTNDLCPSVLVHGISPVTTTTL